MHDPSHPCMSGQRHGSGPKTSFIYIILPRSPVFDDSLHADEITPFNYYWTETNVPTVESLSNENRLREGYVFGRRMSPCVSNIISPAPEVS